MKVIKFIVKDIYQINADDYFLCKQEHCFGYTIGKEDSCDNENLYYWIEMPEYNKFSNPDFSKARHKNNKFCQILDRINEKNIF